MLGFAPKASPVGAEDEEEEAAAGELPLLRRGSGPEAAWAVALTDKVPHAHTPWPWPWP